MLENRTKLIFIRTPGARKALKKQGVKDFSFELNEAIKVNEMMKAQITSV